MSDTATHATETTSPPQRPTAYAWYVAVALMFVQIISMLDRKVIVILAEPIKRDLHLSDAQLGLLTGGVFSFVYAVSSFPLARWADRTSRPLLIAGCMILWSGLTTLGGFTKGFALLAASRMGVAFGEAGASPASHALIANHFPPSARSRALAVYMAGAPLGVLGGLALGGFLNDMFDWRTALIVVGLPGIVVALIIAITVREPLGGRPPSDRAQGSLAATTRLMLRDPVLRFLLLGTSVHFIVIGATYAFLPAYIMREFGLPAARVGLTFGLVSGIAGAAGSIFGGWIGDWLNKGGKSRSIRLVGLAFLCNIPLVAGVMFARDYTLLLLLSGLQTFLMAFYSGPVFSTVQARVTDGQRAMASAIMLFALNGIGLAVGPILTGFVSDALQGLGHDTSASLRLALICLTPLELAAGFWLFRAARKLL